MQKRRAVFGPVALMALLVALVSALTVYGGLGTASASPGAAPAAASSGCGKAPALASGTHTIQSSGQTRSYILRLPANYDSSHPYRLVFGFHWVGGTANDVDSGGTDGYNWSYYGLRKLADADGNGTIFVAPQGINNGWANSGGQDVTFVDDMLSQFESGLCIDTSQIFSSGFSYGGVDDLRAGLRAADGLPRGRGLLRREPERMRRRHRSRSRTSVCTASGTTSCRSPTAGRCATPSSATTSARRRTRRNRRTAA